VRGVPNAVEEVGEGAGVVACTHAIGGLTQQSTYHDYLDDGRMYGRYSLPVEHRPRQYLSLSVGTAPGASGMGTRIKSDKAKSLTRPGNLTKDARTCMNDLDYWAKAADQLATFVPMIFERCFPVSEVAGGRPRKRRSFGVYWRDVSRGVSLSV
jgi:hypothetical protein